jgi:UDP-N-acetylmuramoyl-tripeptide--D-alanyl-D-alanine ligase
LKVPHSTDIGTIVRVSGGTLAWGEPRTPVETITTDSRDTGPGNLFIPLVGEKFDGHSFIEELASSGRLAGFLTMRDELAAVGERYGVAAVRCDDTLRAFGRIASNHRDRMNPTVVGITGTSGKTTTKELLHAMLSTAHPCLKSEKNYNNEVGLPFTLLGLRDEHEFAIVEMGMNHKGEIRRLSAIARPDLAIITNVGEGHLEFLGGVEDVAAAKREIMEGMGPGAVIVLNMDTAHFDLLEEGARGGGLHVVTFGLSAAADVYPEKYSLSEDRVALTLSGREYTAPLYGMHNLYNILAAFAAAHALGIGEDGIAGALSSFRNVGMRSQIIRHGFLVVNDTYNSNPLSARYALMSVADTFPGKRKVAVLADMKELGKESGRYHRDTGRQAAELGFDLICTFGEMAGLIGQGAREAGMNGEAVRHFDRKEDLSAFLARTLAADDVVLIKGSRAMKLEEVVDALVR